MFKQQQHQQQLQHSLLYSSVLQGRVLAIAALSLLLCCAAVVSAGDCPASRVLTPTKRFVPALCSTLRDDGEVDDGGRCWEPRGRPISSDIVLFPVGTKIDESANNGISGGGKSLRVQSIVIAAGASLRIVEGSIAASDCFRVHGKLRWFRRSGQFDDASNSDEFSAVATLSSSTTTSNQGSENNVNEQQQQLAVTSSSETASSATNHPELTKMWSEIYTSDINSPTGFYGLGRTFWLTRPPTIASVVVHETMNAHANMVHDVDIKATKDFLLTLPIAHRRALDCGSGIGRVAKHILTELFATTDLIEPASNLLSVALSSLDPTRVGATVNEPLQKVTTLPSQRYDLIFFGYVAMYLTDVDLVRVLTLARDSLSPTGLVVLKENINTNSESAVREHYVDRCDTHWRMLFDEAGFSVVKHERQPDWDLTVFMDVGMYALQPKVRVLRASAGSTA